MTHKRNAGVRPRRSMPAPRMAYRTRETCLLRRGRDVRATVEDTMKFFFHHNIFLWALLMCILTARAQATPGAQPLLLTEIPRASGAMLIDGALGDWGDARSAVFSPLDGALSPTCNARSDSPRRGARLLRRAGAVPGYRVQGKPLVDGKGGCALTVHVQTDRMAHFLFDPPAAVNNRPSASGTNKVKILVMPSCRAPAAWWRWEQIVSRIPRRSGCPGC